MPGLRRPLVPQRLMSERNVGNKELKRGAKMATMLFEGPFDGTLLDSGNIRPDMVMLSTRGRNYWYMPSGEEGDQGYYCYGSDGSLLTSKPEHEEIHMAERVTREQFIETWESSTSAQEVASRLCMPKALVYAHASRCRREGVELKQMPSSRDAQE